MKLPNDPSKYTSAFKYVEVARYVPPTEDYPKPKLSRLLKGDKGSDPILLNPEDLERYKVKYNSEGIYTSVFQYNNKEFASASFMSSLYFDLDSSDLALSLVECKKLYNHLLEHIPDDAIRVYFSGGKGL
jgi:hypothetical protein